MFSQFKRLGHGLGSLGWLALGLFCWRPAAAADGDQAPADWLLWLLGLPEWIPALALAALFAAFGLLLRAAYRPIRPAQPAASGSPYGMAVAGAVLGVTVAWLSADAWKDYIYDQIAQMPPTGAGQPAQGGATALALLEEPDAAGAAAAPKFAAKVLPGRARHAKVNFSAIEAGTLTLNLFDDLTLIAVRDRIVRDAQGGSVWLGHIENAPNSEVSLAAKGHVLMGTVEWDGRSFEIVYAGGATHAVRELDPDKIPADFEPEDAADGHAIMEGDTTSTTSTSSTSAVTTATGQVIDVLVVYTPRARSNAGGVSGIETKIMNAVARANQAYLNSQVNMQLNLVKMSETAYTESGSVDTALARLRSTTDGYMDDVHALRNQYAADEVVLISADSDYCGVAYRMTSLSPVFAASAFAVVHDDSVYNCLGSNNTFAHELGHTQGNAHNPESSTGTTIYPDSYGYRVCGAARDIMSYSCTGETRIPYFSNPNVLYNGVATGVTGSNNTARSMNATAATVASFRSTTTTATVPNAPGNLAAAATSSSGISLSWTDNASDESGYYVQRSTDGAIWNLVATLASNAVSFADSGLSAGTAYYYRVLAYNSVGNSAYSNTATATTTAVVTATVTDTTAPTVVINNPVSGATVSTNQQVSANASDNVGVTSLKLYIDSALVASTNTGTLSYTWNIRKAAIGSHVISTVAADAAGNNASTSVTVTKK